MVNCTQPIESPQKVSLQSLTRPEGPRISQRALHCPDSAESWVTHGFDNLRIIIPSQCQSAKTEIARQDVLRGWYDFITQRSIPSMPAPLENKNFRIRIPKLKRSNIRTAVLVSTRHHHYIRIAKTLLDYKCFVNESIISTGVTCCDIKNELSRRL